MNFDFSDDQKALAAEARKLLGARARAGSRALINGSPDRYDRELWGEFGRLGWLGIAIPEEFGGAGLGHLETCVLAEEIGRANAALPVASTLYFFAEALALYAPRETRAHWARLIASGTAVGCFAMAESPGEVTEERILARVTDGRLDGEKLPVIDGMAADAAIVVAGEADGGGLSLFLAPLAQAGVTRTPLETLDPSRPVARLSFSGARVERLGEKGAGWQNAQALLDRAAIYLAFEQLGGAEAALEMAVDYAKNRFAFGRPIGSFQAIKHKLADVYVKNQLARANAWYGAWALSANAPELPGAAAMARVAACEAFDFAAKENIQTHGGMGFTWESDCHLLLRRSRHLGLAAGAPAQWREKLVRTLERRNRG